ncbi:hypothetical protein [Actinokineospora spheciospongiae]|uniref:hypothetical protein n=1 Tax=Actinokineospora spheciospongiae TaxID=909613 RepID=UPI000D9E6054|nr:hypothetical protein [Actinokineospora spheciospongiae]PWW67119.1 hypothetical protein DFQ13_101637 [Actinokineospora spheciospongiae]
MSEPPHPPRRPHPDQWREQGHPAQPHRDRYREPGHPDPGYGGGSHQEHGYQAHGYQEHGYQDHGHRDRSGVGYQDGGHQPAGHRPRPRAQRPPGPRPERPQRSESGGGFRIPGLGVVLALLGTLVQVVSLTLLPWLTGAGGDSASLIDLWRTVSADGGPKDFGDWYVLLFSYPLVVLGVLLAFSAVLESVAMKVVWGGLALLGLGYVALRFGLGPFTGLFGVEQGFSAEQLAIGAGALVLAVGVAFALKTAISMFRRIAGVVLLALSGVHVSAVVDLAKGVDLADLSLGAFGPTVGYLLIGIAALVGPRRFA